MVGKTRNSTPGLLVASRNELKVGKLEIDSLYLYEKIPRNIGDIIEGLYRVWEGGEGRINN